MRRPAQIVHATGLYGCWWVLSMLQARHPNMDASLLGPAIWTAVLGWMLYRLWRGGPIVWWWLTRLGLGLGILSLLGSLLFAGALLLPRTEGSSIILITGPLGSAALIGASLLLFTAPAKAWCRRGYLPNHVPGHNPWTPGDDAPGR